MPRFLLYILLGMFFIMHADNSYAQAPQVLLLDSHTLVENKQKIKDNDASAKSAYNQLIKDANKLLTRNSPAVTEKKQVPPSEDKHDYMSLATYYWPDPTKPNGLPYIAKDGKVTPELNSIPDHQNFQNVVSWSQTLALAYFYSDDKRYAAKSAELLRKWFINPHTKMNPNLNFAQAIKGKRDGSPSGIVDGQILLKTIDTIKLIENSGNLTTADKNGLNTWFTEYLNWLQTSKLGRTESNAENNTGTWYDVQVASIALFVNKQNITKQILTDAQIKRIAQQIEPDGKQPFELARTKSWDYSVFNLQALCDLAVLGSNVDIDLWHYQTPDGRSIAKAFDFLMPYALEEKTWNYKQIAPLSLTSFFAPLQQAANEINVNQYMTLNKQLMTDNVNYNLFLSY